MSFLLTPTYDVCSRLVPKSSVGTHTLYPESILCVSLHIIMSTQLLCMSTDRVPTSLAGTGGYVYVSYRKPLKSMDPLNKGHLSLRDTWFCPRTDKYPSEYGTPLNK